jgi:uncharacterized protein (TIGR03067 family)
MPDGTALPGIWEMIRAEQNGEDAAALLALRIELELGANTYVVRFAGQIADRGTCTALWPEAVGGTSGTLTLTGSEGPNAGRTIPCLCQIAGDRLRVCFGLDGTLPTGFSAAAGQPRYLATYRRQRPLDRS